MIVKKAEGRGQQAKRGGGQEAAGAACHRAQRGRIRGYAQAHLAPRPTLRERAVAGAAHICSIRTPAQITMKEVSSSMPDVLIRLLTSTDDEQYAQHAR